MYAGKTHIDDGDTRAEACEVAERKAKISAENSGINGTCYDINLIWNIDHISKPDSNSKD